MVGKRGQRKAVLEHFQTKGELTSMEAFQLFGATRLAAIVFDLRRDGYSIETQEILSKTRYGETCQYAKYIYHGKEEA